MTSMNARKALGVLIWTARAGKERPETLLSLLTAAHKMDSEVVDRRHWFRVGWNQGYARALLDYGIEPTKEVEHAVLPVTSALPKAPKARRITLGHRDRNTGASSGGEFIAGIG